MIELKDVYKTLGRRSVLRGLSFRVEPGETFILVGPSGTGKSVTLSHIIGLMNPDSGTVTVDGVDVPSLSRKELEKLRLKLGMLFQGGALLNWLNIYDNVALPLRERTRMTEEQISGKVMEILDFLEMGTAAYKMPAEVSGGMMKRAGLARAIVCNPEIMLYDEPTSGLDPVMSRKIDRLIDTLKKKYRMTSVVVTHDLVSALHIGDRIAMIADGRIIADDRPEAFLKNQHPLVREFIHAQFNTGKKVPS